MTPEINELIKKITSAKGIAALLVLFFLAVFIWSNLDFLTEVSFTFKRDGASEEQASTEDVDLPRCSGHSWPMIGLTPVQ